MADLITFGTIQGTPLYVTKTNNPAYSRVYGAKFIKEIQSWVFPAFHPFSQMVISDFETIKDDEVQLELSPDAEAWAAEQAFYPGKIERREVHPDFTFVTKPFDHQVESVAFAVRNLRCLLALAMGSGKTKVAIDTLRYVNQFKGGAKALVIVPRVILHKWGAEVLFHGGGELKPVIIDGTPKKKLKLLQEPGDVYVCTYGTASRMQEELVQLPYNTLVVDESHNLQTASSDKTKAVIYLSRKAPRRILMSGTASLGDPRHLYGQFAVMAPFMLEENFFKFCNRYIHYGDQQRRIILGFKNLDILNARLKTVSIQKTREECVDLPERTFDTVKYELAGEQRSTYNALVAADYSEVSEMCQVPEEAAAATRLTKLLQICSGYLVKSNKNLRVCDGCKYMGACVDQEIKPYTKQCLVVPKAPPSTVIEFKENPKLTAFKELLEMAMVDPTCKVVVWGHYLKELDDLEKTLGDLGYQYVRVDGSVGAARMQECVKTFQTDPDVRVYLGQVATGIGVDLVASNVSIYYSLDYDLGHYLQSLDRNLRIGQTRKVAVYTLIGEGTVEEAVWQALQQKEDIRAALMSKSGTQSEIVRRVTRPTKV